MKRVMIFIAAGVFLISCSKIKSQIPVFNLLMPDSTTVYSTANIPKGKITMLVFFSPYCEHCQDEVKDIIKNIDSVRSMRFYFISIESISRIREFAEYFELRKYPNITLGQDYQASFARLSGLRKIPSSLMYDEYGRLRVTIRGSFSTSQLLEYSRRF